MTYKRTLRGMAWDHPRARQPLYAVAMQWSESRPVTVEWDARSLKEFEDQPLEELTQKYDIVLIDHPFVGAAAISQLLVPVEEWADAAYLADQANHSVGPSFASYRWAEKQWALPIDAACQVAAVRHDLWGAAGIGSLPDTWTSVAEIARQCSAGPNQIGIPLNPNHAYCAFLSIGTALAGEEFWPVGKHVDREAAGQTLEFLRQLAATIHPQSRNDDPIAMSERMTSSDEVVYVPLMFGYSSYCRRGFRSHCLSFRDAPLGASGRRGSVLGGVGIALSARSKNADLASELARHLASPPVQAGLYASAGGQPGHGTAWASDTVNAQTDDFFAHTRDTMNQAFIRPRVPGHREFQPRAGALIHNHIWSRSSSADACLDEYEDLVDLLLPEWLAGDEKVALLKKESYGA